MKNTFALVLCVALVGIGFAAEYTDQFDNINVSQILNNNRLFNNYMKCLLDVPGAKCTADATKLKSLLPEALMTNCEKCTDKQKENSKLVIAHLAKKRPADWEKLLAKYDPQNVYRTTYKAEAQKLGVPV